MKTIRRREFLGTALAGGAALMAGSTSSAFNAIPPSAKEDGLHPSLRRHPQSADSRVEILLNEKIGQISPDLYGHFVEHLGGVVYDGIWVGEDSKVPNLGGIRQELVEHLKRIKASVVRWPGGCFADSYNWRDGIGPRKDRPRRTNFWRDSRGNRTTPAYERLNTGPQKYEPNWFGTNEFMRFCKLTGMKPYLAANLRSLPAKDFLTLLAPQGGGRRPRLWRDERRLSRHRRAERSGVYVLGHGAPLFPCVPFIPFVPSALFSLPAEPGAIKEDNS
jgi:hypothetical protein